nr:MAG TPA: hypothetical protein [Caudoviricetes sp.]
MYEFNHAFAYFLMNLIIGNPRFFYLPTKEQQC